METRIPKTLEDFPTLSVTAMRRGATSDTGYTRFEFDGNFDRVIEGIESTWFWLLFGGRRCLCATLTSLNRETRAAVITCDEKDDPEIVGQTLYYLSPYWQAFHVWMVLDPTWGWERMQFQRVDAVAEDYEAPNISIVGGREVKIWTKVEPLKGNTGQSRHYPAPDQTLPLRSGTRVIPAGWDHEHCDLCKAHIEVGDFGYCDPGKRWMCTNCYERYVEQRDLAFVDEL